MDTLSRMTLALPQEFDFYHLGSVRRLTEKGESGLAITPTFDDEDTTVVAFNLLGDTQGIMLVAFDRALDRSTYIEMGNVLASRWATSLSRETGLDLMISPPRELKPEQLKTIIEPSKEKFKHQTYLHYDRNTAVEIEAWVLSITPEEKAHA